LIINVKNIFKSFRAFHRKAGLKGAITSFFKREYKNFDVLKDINLRVNEGEIIGILGENGAGKTTLIKLMVGLLHPTSGSIDIGGYTPWKRNHKFLKDISIVMGQKNQLWWDIPASESFLLNQKLYDIDEKIYKDKLAELSELFDVKDKLDIQVRRLSLGERMKMEIIAALLHNPKIIFLDEPTIGLDVVAQSKVRDFIKYYNDQYNTTFLLTSHYMHDIQSLCKRVFIIHKGENLFDGDFSNLVKAIKPQKKLLFTFNDLPSSEILEKLNNDFSFKISNKLLSTNLPDEELNNLLSQLFKLDTPISFSIEDLPVEDTMKEFFTDPKKFI